ncbi:MAG TPA: CpaF family protein, partial [Aestuariivirga sp.]|nr:CpaF family protein [Aestuariivirga sp.]
MFGKRSDNGLAPPVTQVPLPPATAAASSPGLAAPAAPGFIPDLPMQTAPGQFAGSQPARAPAPPQPAAPRAPAAMRNRSDNYYDIKGTIFNALIDAIDLGQLDRDAARDEIRDIVNEIITLKDVVMSIAEQEELLEDICNDVLGYGPLEPLLARDDIADIMVNGA